MKKFLSLSSIGPVCSLLVAAVIVFITGCSTNGENDTKSNFRIINAVPDVESLDFFIDFKPYLDNIGYLESSGYSTVESDSHKLTASVSGSFTPLVDTTVTFNDQFDYSLFVFGPSNRATHLLKRDDNDPPSKDTASIRVLNAASGTGAIDVYILNPSQGLGDATPSVKSLSYKGMSNYLVSEKGSYTIIVTTKGSKDIVASTSAKSLSGNSVYTVLVSDSGGEGLAPKIVLLQDR